MTEFYCPATRKITLPSGCSFQLRKGIHALPDELVFHTDANGYGIKPVEEMTDEEWKALALDKVKWMAANRPAPKAADPIPAPQVAPQPLPKPVAATPASPAA